jgi:hypothetical protein
LRGAAWLHYGLYFALVVYVISCVIVPALHEETFGYGYDAERGYGFRDFAGILVMAKAMWSGQAGYDVDSHLSANRAWVGHQLDTAMPFPYSPTMLYVLGPFCLLPPARAFAAWSLLNLTVVGWIIARKDCPPLLGPIVFLTPTAMMCFALGQSALLAAAALIYLGGATLRNPGERRPNVWLMTLVLWALTARPQLAITAGVALLAARQWRPVLLALALALVTTALLTPLLGSRWVTDYFTLISHYDRVTAPDAFRWALVPDHMNNLRALLTTLGVPDDMSSKVSTAVWLLTLVGVLASALLRGLPPALVWGACVLLQLLLCPHVNTYELILLYAVLVFFLKIDLAPLAFRSKAAWVIPVLLCLTAVGESFELGRRWLLIMGLVGVAGMTAWLYIAALRRPVTVRLPT